MMIYPGPPEEIRIGMLIHARIFRLNTNRLELAQATTEFLQEKTRKICYLTKQAFLCRLDGDMETAKYYSNLVREATRIQVSPRMRELRAELDILKALKVDENID